MKELTSKMAGFFSGEDFAEHGEDARLEMTPADLRQISNLMTENTRLKTKLDKHNKAFDNIKDTLNKWNPDTKRSILSVWSILDRNLEEFKADISEDADNVKNAGIAEQVRNSQLSASELSEIFNALKDQGECLGGKFWTTQDIEYKLDEMSGESISVTQEAVNAVCNELSYTDVLDDCTDREWEAFEDAIRNASLKISITDIEWDTDDEDADVPELPKNLLIPLDGLDEKSVEDYLSDEYGFCVKALTAEYVSDKEV